MIVLHRSLVLHQGPDHVHPLTQFHHVRVVHRGHKLEALPAIQGLGDLLPLELSDINAQRVRHHGQNVLHRLLQRLSLGPHVVNRLVVSVRNTHHITRSRALQDVMRNFETEGAPRVAYLGAVGLSHALHRCTHPAFLHHAPEIHGLELHNCSPLLGDAPSLPFAHGRSGESRKKRIFSQPAPRTEVDIEFFDLAGVAAESAHRIRPKLPLHFLDHQLPAEHNHH
mmetsp:Transcript_60827/g.163215  ORF Transcript_60827/g.163215 Transcript_60827/m.163215 type:complete len:225 (-) Transcript_60827:87-761(-)